MVRAAAGLGSASGLVVSYGSSLMVKVAAGLGSSSGLMVSYCSRIMVSRAEGPGRSSGGSLSGEGADGEAGFFTACSWTRGRVAQLGERAQLPGDFAQTIELMLTSQRNWSRNYLAEFWLYSSE